MSQVPIFLADCTSDPQVARAIANHLTSAGNTIYVETVGADPSAWWAPLSDRTREELCARPVAIVILETIDSLHYDRVRRRAQKLAHHLGGEETINPVRLESGVICAPPIHDEGWNHLFELYPLILGRSPLLSPLLVGRTPVFMMRSDSEELGLRLRSTLFPDPFTGERHSNDDSVVNSTASSSDSPTLVEQIRGEDTFIDQSITDTFARARICAFQGRYQQAAQMLEAAGASTKQLSGLWSALAYSYLQCGEWEKCVAAGWTAFNDMSERVTSLCCVGYGLFHQGRAQEALGPFHRALSIGADYPAAWLGYGKSLVAVGRKDEARDAFNKALAVRPNNPWAYDNQRVWREVAKELHEL